MDQREEFVEKFTSLYNKFKKNFYKYIFNTMESDDKSNLTPLEVFTLEVIYLLGRPTVNELAKWLDTSQPNTAYKVTSLVKKGYLERRQSKEDKREYYLVLTHKFKAYYNEKSYGAREMITKISEEISQENLLVLNEAIDRMNEIVVLDSKE